MGHVKATVKGVISGIAGGYMVYGFTCLETTVPRELGISVSRRLGHPVPGAEALLWFYAFSFVIGVANKTTKTYQEIGLHRAEVKQKQLFSVMLRL